METLGSSLVVAVVAAIVTANLTLRRTKGESRWKSKYDAYTRILSAIEDMRFWAEETYASEHMLPTVHGDQLRAAAIRYDEAKRLLWSYVHVGALVVCEEARERLEAMLGEIAREEYRFNEEDGPDEDYSQRMAEHCDKVREIISRHITTVLDLAKRDLD